MKLVTFVVLCDGTAVQTWRMTTNPEVQIHRGTAVLRHTYGTSR